MGERRKKTKAAGTARERQVKAQLEAEGWVVVRSPASGSPVDLWAMRVQDGGYQAGTWAMGLQIKANTGSPFKNFQPQERQELRDIAERAGATPWLVHWPPHKPCRWIKPEEWP